MKGEINTFFWAQEYDRFVVADMSYSYRTLAPTDNENKKTTNSSTQVPVSQITSGNKTKTTSMPSIVLTTNSPTESPISTPTKETDTRTFSPIISKREKSTAVPSIGITEKLTTVPTDSVENELSKPGSNTDEPTISPTGLTSKESISIPSSSLVDLVTGKTTFAPSNLAVDENDRHTTKPTAMRTTPLFDNKFSPPTNEPTAIAASLLVTKIEPTSRACDNISGEYLGTINAQDFVEVVVDFQYKAETTSRHDYQFLKIIEEKLLNMTATKLLTCAEVRNRLLREYGNGLMKLSSLPWDRISRDSCVPSTEAADYCTVVDAAMTVTVPKDEASDVEMRMLTAVADSIDEMETATSLLPNVVEVGFVTETLDGILAASDGSGTRVSISANNAFEPKQQNGEKGDAAQDGNLFVTLGILPLTLAVVAGIVIPLVSYRRYVQERRERYDDDDHDDRESPCSGREDVFGESFDSSFSSYEEVDDDDDEEDRNDNGDASILEEISRQHSSELYRTPLPPGQRRQRYGSSRSMGSFGSGRTSVRGRIVRFPERMDIIMEKSFESNSNSTLNSSAFEVRLDDDDIFTNSNTP